MRFSAIKLLANHNLWHAVVWAGFPQSTSKAISSYDANEVLSDDAGGHWWPNRAEVRAEELTVVFEIMGNDAFDAYLAYEDDAHNEAVQLAICISYYAKDILKRVGEVPEGCYTAALLNNDGFFDDCFA